MHLSLLTSPLLILICQKSDYDALPGRALQWKRCMLRRHLILIHVMTRNNIECIGCIHKPPSLLCTSGRFLPSVPRPFLPGIGIFLSSLQLSLTKTEQGWILVFPLPVQDTLFRRILYTGEVGGGGSRTGNGTKPIKCVLSSKLPPGATGAQASWGPLGDCIIYSPKLLHPTGRELGCLYTNSLAGTGHGCSQQN